MIQGMLLVDEDDTGDLLASLWNLSREIVALVS
jgi:dUTPase